jgi:expansin (peptidoglycan-binding protein)
MSTGYNLNMANQSGQPPMKVRVSDIKGLDRQRHNPIFTKPLFKKRINRNGKVKLIQIRNL